jgi:8-oxo-dGTP pyrophosphatase MutT (NUDIX family)
VLTRRPSRDRVAAAGRGGHPASMVEHLTAPTGGSPLLDAATTVVVRDGEPGLECLMLRKNRGQAFGGAWVFPGGRVEDGDGTGLDGAMAAAVREAEEETGLVLDAATLVPFAHWTPPDDAPRRYATWFFLAPLPVDATDVVVDGGEIGDHVWTTPAAALERHSAGEVSLLPPTWMSLRRIRDLPDAAAAMADVGAGEVERYSTHMVTTDGVMAAVWRPDAAYESDDLGTPGPRHRLTMDPAGWRYERSA